MNETYQNRITDQICKIQTDKKLIAFYDKLLTTSYNSFAQLHAKGEYVENGHKAHSLIGISIQDYSSGTGDRNIITRFHLAPEQIQFLLTRITAGFPEFEWSQSKIFGNPDTNGYSTAQQFFISRHVYNSKQEVQNSPWRIQIVNGKGIKKTESKWWFLYAGKKLCFRKNCFHTVDRYGSLYPFKTSGLLHHQLGGSLCTDLNHKR